MADVTETGAGAGPGRIEFTEISIERGEVIAETFELVRSLGKGGMGEVFLARDLRLGRHVALKFIGEDQAERALQLSLREARATARLKHSNIVTLYQVGRAGDRVFLVLELLEGTSLAQRLANGPVHVKQVIDWGIQIARALQHAHDEGVVHRDLKPGNVFIQSDGLVKVLDFGIAGLDLGHEALLDASGLSAAELATDLGRTVAAAGTPGYMAPEQWRGAPADPRSDIWALGVLLFECLSGHRPFTDPPHDFAAGPPTLNGVPPALAELVRDMLTVQTKERVPNAETVITRLESLRQPKRSYRLRIALGLGILLVFGVGINQWYRAQAAAADIGTFELHLKAYDWEPTTQSARAASSDGYSVSVYRQNTEDSNLPGKRLTDVTIERETHDFRVQAPGGTHFMRVERPNCTPAWVLLRDTPGFNQTATFTITIPTCQASTSTLITIPQGPYWRTDQDTQELVMDQLPSFTIDRTEVSNAAYAQYAAMGSLTGDGMPSYPPLPKYDDIGKADHPVTHIDWYAARAFCAYHGKRLPTSAEWDKAARGGLVLAGQLNPSPKRRFPWGDEPGIPNLNGADGFATTHPVGLDHDQSPYGVLGLAGNVQEWVADSAGNRLRVLRGGEWDAPLDAAATNFGRVRDAQYVDFVTGVRCAGLSPVTE